MRAGGSSAAAGLQLLSFAHCLQKQVAFVRGMLELFSKHPRGCRTAGVAWGWEHAAFCDLQEAMASGCDVQSVFMLLP